MAITHAGIFLSQPPIVTNPSKPCAAETASIESAIISLDTNEYLIPGVPIEIPSDTVMVLNMIPFAPDSSTPDEVS